MGIATLAPKHLTEQDDILPMIQAEIYWNEYIYKKTYVENPVLRQILNTILISPFTLIGLLLFWIFPKNEDLYLDNVVLARKIKNV